MKNVGKINKQKCVELLTVNPHGVSLVALKLIRAKSLSGNPTPISEEEAEAKVLVEIKPITRKPRTGRKQWKAVMKNA